MSNIGRMVGSERAAAVYVHDDAIMTVPLPEWLWPLRYQRPEPDRGTKCDDRMLAAGVCESYLYLIEECTKEEAWRRIKIMRKALAEHRVRQKSMMAKHGGSSD